MEVLVFQAWVYKRVEWTHSKYWSGRGHEIPSEIHMKKISKKSTKNTHGVGCSTDSGVFYFKQAGSWLDLYI